jgi:hypothetical protein
MPVSIGAGWRIGPGVSLGSGGGFTFTLTSADISGGYGGYNSWFDGATTQNYPVALGTNGVDGFSIAFYPGQPSGFDKVGNVPYSCTITSQAIVDFFNNLVTQGVITSATNTLAVWDVTWGVGSTSPTGAVVLGGVGSVGNTMYMATADTSIPGYDTNPPNTFSTVTKEGTWLFPATFTLRTPAVDKGGWC